MFTRSKRRVLDPHSGDSDSVDILTSRPFARTSFCSECADYLKFTRMQSSVKEQLAGGAVIALDADVELASVILGSAMAKARALSTTGPIKGVAPLRKGLL